MDWQTIINTIGSLYPDENFWNWLKTAFPEGYPTVMGQDVASNIDKFYKEYQSGTEAIGQVTPFAPQDPFLGAPPEQTGLSPYEYPYVREYLQSVIDDMRLKVEAGTLPQEEADQILAEFRDTLLTGGLESAQLTELEKSGKYDTKALGDNLREQFGQYLTTAPTVNIEGTNYKYLGGVFYDMSDKRMGSQFQPWLSQQLDLQTKREQTRLESIGEPERGIIGAADWETMKQKWGEKEAWKKYQEYEKWWAEQDITAPSTLMPGWKPEVGIAGTPQEAIGAGYGWYIPQEKATSPQFTTAYLKGLMDALRRESFSKLKGGEPGQPGYDIAGYKNWQDVLEKLSPSQRAVIQQSAFFNAAEAVGGYQPVATPSELRAMSKQGIDVSRASNLLRPYFMQQKLADYYGQTGQPVPEKGVPPLAEAGITAGTKAAELYSQRAGMEMHVGAYNRLQAQQRKKAEEWKALQERIKSQAMRPQRMISL